MNDKKLLCRNIVNNNYCPYGNNCRYAHHLREQNINELRKRVFKIINSNTDLNNINLYKDTELLNELIVLTKECTNCVKNNCVGGYNCKNGVNNKKYKICFSDLIYGNCSKIHCNDIHLTKRNLVPYNDIVNSKKRIMSIFFSKDEKKIKNKKEKINKIIDTYFTTSSKDTEYTIDEDDKKIIDYLNS